MTLLKNLVLATVLLGACGGASRRSSNHGNPGDSDAGTSQGPSQPTTHCPCASGEYCNLADDTCHPGCDSNDACSNGQFCDLSAHTCRTGCGSDAECNTSQGERCVNHACGIPCQQDYECGNNGDCNTSTCQNGLCAFSGKPEGASCGDSDSECVKHTCQSGSCEANVLPDGTACTPSASGSGCSTAQCSGGSCETQTVPEGALCTGSTSLRCHDTTCVMPTVTCTYTPATASSPYASYSIDTGSGPEYVSGCYCSNGGASATYMEVYFSQASGYENFAACSSCVTQTSGFSICWK